MSRKRTRRFRRARKADLEVRREVHSDGHCGATGKTCFRTLEAAVGAIEHLRENSQRPVVPQRAYWCKFCARFHLTSRTKGGAA